MRTLRYVTADVFTDKPFSGNPLAVVFGAEGLSTETLQAITREFNYSETVFVFAPGEAGHNKSSVMAVGAPLSHHSNSPIGSDGSNITRDVRIFTPARELPFAGHPTIGCAHALVAIGEIEASGSEVTVVLGEGVGPVPVRVTLEGGKPVHAQLTTAQPPEERHDVPLIEQLAEVLSLAPSDFVGAELPPAGVSCGIPFLIIPLRSSDAVRRARVATAAWEKHLSSAWASEPMVFAMTSPDDGDGNSGAKIGASIDTRHDAARGALRGCDIHARVFVPGLSVPEDPATGSANACLAAYLAARVDKPSVGGNQADSATAGRVLTWEVAQGVEMGRPSRLSIEATLRDGAIESIRVGGASVLVSRGTMTIPE